MTDSFEKNIRERRGQLDTETPPNEIWIAIRKSHFEKKRANWKWQIAASILFLLSVTLSVLLYQSESKSDPSISIVQIDPSYEDLEREYQHDIKQLTSTINFNTLRVNGFQWLIDELESIENVNATFKNDLKRKGNNEKLIQILIDQYEKKLKVLKRIELELKRLKNENKEDNTIS